MKVLMLSQGREIADQPDYDDSFRNAESEGKRVELLNIPFRGYIEKHGSDAFYGEVVRACWEFKPDLVFFQFFHSSDAGGLAECIRSVRSFPQKPLVFGSLGDPFDTRIIKRSGRGVPAGTLRLASCADAFFSTSMGDISRQLVRHGAKNVVFLPHAFCPMHFPDWEIPVKPERKRDVVMLCSNQPYLTRHLGWLWCNNIRRKLTVWRLRNGFGTRFAVYGKGWRSCVAKGRVPFAAQLDVYRQSRVAVDAPASVIDRDYYASDRPFFILGSGTPLVFFHTPRFDKILRPNEHAFYVYHLGDVCDVCRQALRLCDEELEERKHTAMAFVKQRHLIRHRVDTILSVAEAIRKARRGMLSPDEALRNVRMWHFLPDVDMEEELEYAVANWRA